MLTGSGSGISHGWIQTNPTSGGDWNTFRIKQLYELLNQVSKSGFVNIGPIIEEILRLHGHLECYVPPTKK